MQRNFLPDRSLCRRTHAESQTRFLRFAKQITGKYMKFGKCSLNAPSLVFVGENKTTTIHTFQKKLQIKLSVKLSDGSASSFAFRMKLSGQEKAMKELQAFHCISTIFENRERQPDVARKAERKLIRILSEDFYDRNPVIQRAVSGERMFYRWERKAAEAEAEKTKNLVENMEERLLLQEKLIKELKETETVPAALPKGWMDGVTKEVMKKMERELHLEKMRRGFV